MIVPFEVVLLCSLTSIQVEHCSDDKQENLIKEAASLLYIVFPNVYHLFLLWWDIVNTVYYIYILCTMYIVH